MADRLRRLRRAVRSSPNEAPAPEAPILCRMVIRLRDQRPDAHAHITPLELWLRTGFRVGDGEDAGEFVFSFTAAAPQDAIECAAKATASLLVAFAPPKLHRIINRIGQGEISLAEAGNHTWSVPTFTYHLEARVISGWVDLPRGASAALARALAILGQQPQHDARAG